MKMTPQSRMFHEMLPEDLRKVSSVSMSYCRNLSIVSSHLQTIYGKYANPDYCLQYYLGSDSYKQNKQIIRRCPDLPLIEINEILSMLVQEQAFARTRDELLHLYHEKKDDCATIEKMASILGIFPDRNINGLYRWLVAKDAISEQELTNIREGIGNHYNLLSVITNILTKTFIDGILMEFPAAGCVMTQQRNRYYYRGENAYYRTSKASCFRVTEFDMPETYQPIIQQLRLWQCCDMLDKLDAIKNWQFSEVQYLALAQHYGLRTQMTDITSDLKTALFFACCKYGNDQRWHPLDTIDFSHRNSRVGVSKKCNGDSRYGVIYRCPAEITDLQWCNDGEKNAFGIIIPVGFQPFMRCSCQHAYMLLTRHDDDLLFDKRFDKFKFRLTAEICNWIYEEMDRGNKIYPQADVPDISKEIEAHNRQKAISDHVFKNSLPDVGFTANDAEKLKDILNTVGITIQDEVNILSPERITQIDRVYSAQRAMELIGISPQMSPIITI